MTRRRATVNNSSQVIIRMGGKEYPVKRNRNCKVCNSDYRFDIEDGLITGSKYANIVADLPEGHGLSARNVMDHYNNGHLPLDQTRVRAIEEAHAERMGRDIQQGAEDLVDGITLLKVVVQKTFERVARGEVTPELTDGVRAAAALGQLGEYDEGGADSQAMTEAFMIYMESAQEHMTAEQFEQFGESLDSNPVLKALSEKYERGHGGESETVSGSTVPARL